MKPEKGGNATGPPKLGRAIIGATLLLKGDALTSPEPPQQVDKAPRTAHGTRIRLEMPPAGFGKAGKPAVAEVAASQRAAKAPKVQPPYAYSPPVQLPPFQPPLLRQQRSQLPRSAPIPAAPQLAAELPSARPGKIAPTPVDKPLFDLPPGEAVALPAQSEVPAAPDPSAVAPAVIAEAPSPGPPDGQSAATAQLPQPEFGGPVQPSATTASQAGPPVAATSSPPPLPEPQFGVNTPPPAPESSARAAAEPDATPEALPEASSAERAAAELASPPRRRPQASPPPPPASQIVAETPSPDLPAETQPAPDLTPLSAVPPRALSDAQLATVQAPTMPGPAEASAERLPGASTGAELTATASNSLPEPEFGKAAEPPLRQPTRLALAEIPPQPAALPRPEFGPAVPGPAAVEPPPAELAAARTSAVPLQDSPSGPGVIPLPSQAARNAGYVDTSPRMPGAPAPKFTPDDELILQLQTQRGDMADTIIAYGTRSGVYLPLGAIARFLDLAISVSDNGNYASGWFIDEKQTLALNLREGTLQVSGAEVPFDKGDAAAFEGELYLRSERFADLFPLNLTVDLRAQTAVVKTRVPFPFEQRLARDEERTRMEGLNARTQKRWPREATPWQALSFPLIDAELRAVTDRTLGTRGEGDMRLAGDFAFMTARLFAEASTRDGLTGARIELGRRDPDSDLIGPLKASEFQLGDVSTVALPLGLRGTSGRGAFVTNAPLERASVFDTIDLDGDLPDGYEVELYRNNILIGSTRSPVNGQYQFLKVATDYGLNVFRLVFYGPQGQRREEVRQISVGDGRLSTGELVYTFGAAQKDTNVFGVRGPNFSPSLDYGAWRSSALMEYGLSRDVTASLGGAWYESRFGQRWMATAGLRTGLSGTALKLDLGYQSSGGKAVQVGLGGKLAGFGYTLTHSEYQGGFTDELRSFTGDPMRRATELNVNTTIKLGKGEQPTLLPIYGQLRRVEFADGRKQTDATLRASLPLKGLMFSNTLTYAGNSIPGIDTAAQLRGNFDLATLSGSRLHLRAGVDYSVLPRLRLEGATVEADYALDDRTLVRGTVGHTFSDSQTNLSLSAVRRFGKFTLAFDGNYAVPTGDYGAALRLGFSFGRNPLNGRLFFAEPGLAGGGAIAARAFRDSNGNRAFDPGEAVLPDVDFRIGSGYSKTDARGVAFIGGLGDGNRANLTADRESLPDIALAPVSEGIEVVPRAGRVHVTDYAVQELSDIEGTAFFSEGGSLGREVSGLSLQLIDAQGKHIARARTEGDGSFFFEQIQPGNYVIKIDANQAASLKIHLTEAINVTIGPKSAWLKQVVKVSAD